MKYNALFLLDDELVIYESAETMAYLIDKFPEVRLIDSSPWEELKTDNYRVRATEMRNKLFLYIAKKDDSIVHVVNDELEKHGLILK